MAVTGEQFYQNAIDEYKKKVGADLSQQTAQVNANTQNQLRQAYVQKMQNQQQLNNRLAQSGIRGGATQTANLNLANAYNTNRNTINADASAQRTQLNTNANDNIFNYTQQMKTAEAEYLQNRQAEEEQKLNDYYTALYSKSYSTTDLKKALENASTQAEQTAINTRIAYLYAHKKKY